MGEMEIMENINYQQYLDKIEQYENDIKLLEDEKAQLSKEVKNIENLETTTIQERKDKSKQLIEKRSELEVTSEALQSLKNEFEQYCISNADEVVDVLLELQHYLSSTRISKENAINNEIKEYAKKLCLKIQKEVEEQNKLENEVSNIHKQLVKITKYSRASFTSHYGVEYSDMYSDEIFGTELKRLALE